MCSCRFTVSSCPQVSWETATRWSTLPGWFPSFGSVPSRARPWRPTSSAGGWSSGESTHLLAAPAKLGEIGAHAAAAAGRSASA